MAIEENEPMSPLERCVIYQGFADAFRWPDGGWGILRDDVLPPPSPEAKSEFVEAFDQAVSDNACSLYEGEYVTQERSALFEDLVRLTDHFGLKRKTESDLPDHVSVESEVMHFLAYKEHLHQHDDEALGNLQRAQKDFLSRHLLPLARGIQETCKSEDRRYGALPKIFVEFVSGDLAALEQNLVTP